MTGNQIITTILFNGMLLFFYGIPLYLVFLLIKALHKYLQSGEVRKEKAAACKSLGEALKHHRIQKKMTQEFVAEHLGVSRQAVSKWETGSSDPSTSNLLALAKLYGVSAEELLREVQN
ncbi:MAG: helix-turn-helix transcriptional regulator [Oscillospiraceae bacterium]|nr:helix-turn-helix transcriptional regulator [Oscillospiraceae bacterium]